MGVGRKRERAELDVWQRKRGGCEVTTTGEFARDRERENETTKGEWATERERERKMQDGDTKSEENTVRCFCFTAYQSLCFNAKISIFCAQFYLIFDFFFLDNNGLSDMFITN